MIGPGCLGGLDTATYLRGGALDVIGWVVGGCKGGVVGNPCALCIGRSGRGGQLVMGSHSIVATSGIGCGDRNGINIGALNLS